MVLRTPDGRWRVEVAQKGSRHGYRLLDTVNDNELDWLGIATVERILKDNGVDMADLVEVDPDTPITDNTRRAG